MFENVPLQDLTYEDFITRYQYDRNGQPIITGIAMKPNYVSTFVMIYADYCGFCQQAKPDFARLYYVTKDTCSVNVAALNSQRQPKIAQLLGVQKYPTFLLFSPDGTFQEYNGPRDIQSLLRFVGRYCA